MTLYTGMDDILVADKWDIIIPANVQVKEFEPIIGFVKEEFISEDEDN